MVRYFERVVVGLAMAPVDRDVLRYARRILDMAQGKPRFSFVHVSDPSKAGKSRAPLDEIRSALQGDVEREFGHSRDITVVDGNLVDALLQEVADAEADLVVVGHRRDARGRRSLSRRLATKAPCSVWMVPEGTEPRITSVLAAVDMSVPSAQALSAATLVASRAGLSTCTALHVQEPSTLGFDDAEVQSATHELEQFVAPIECHGVTVVPRIVEAGSVAGGVHRLTEPGGHDLVVMGTRGRSSSAAVLLGSESEHVLVESRVPVLITKAPGERVGLVRALLDREFHPRYRPSFG